jgi:hypothetical protein
MRKLSWCRALAVLAGITLTLLGGLGWQWSWSNALALPVQAAAAAPQEKYYVGARFCSNCHLKPNEGNDTSYVSRTEFTRWKEDKHSQAYLALTQPRGQAMAEILKYDVKIDKRCLNCHAANVPQRERRNDFEIADGVSCDACHGPSSQWIVPHADKRWRTTSREDKMSLGMHDVRDPVVLSRLCVSCHVGSPAEGKVVMHDMYAAGHPPLPSIEIATFCEKMPRHWRHLHDKSPDIQRLLRTAYHLPDSELERTKLTMLGAVVSFQASLKLLAAQDEANPSPELANYNCYACHHELKSPSWRQQAGYPGPPGRPRMHDWPTALLRDLVRQLDDKAMEKAYDEGLRELQRAFGVRPFGDVPKIVAAAKRMDQWCERLLERLRKETCDAAVGRRLVHRLCAVEAGKVGDYDSARQRAWAIQAILDEIAPKLSDSVAKEFQGSVNLDLPSGTKRELLKELPAGLGKMNAYEPEKFFSSLKELRPLLPRP